MSKLWDIFRCNGPEDIEESAMVEWKHQQLAEDVHPALARLVSDVPPFAVQCHQTLHLNQ